MSLSTTLLNPHTHGLLLNPLLLDPTRTTSLRRRVENSSDVKVWQECIRCAYLAGARRSYEDVNPPSVAALLGNKYKSGVFIPNTVSLADRYEGALHGFLLNPRRMVTADTLATNAVSIISQRILGEAAAKGINPIKAASQLVKADPSLTKAQALRLARTELIRAYAEGQLDTLTELGVTDVTAAVEWLITNDAKVCPRCRVMSGKVFSIEEARGKIPLHPQCRCAWIPSEGVDVKATISAPEPVQPLPPVITPPPRLL